MEKNAEHNRGLYDSNFINDDFPREDTFECWDGSERIFIISCREFPGAGFFVEAVEKGKNRMGYEFAAHSETSPYLALGDLRKKMYKALAQRHISKKDGEYFPLHDLIEGRITSDENGELAVVVDGICLSARQLLGLFETYGGFQFKLSFAEFSD